MQAKVKSSFVVESVTNPLIAFGLEIAYTKSKSIILQVSGLLKMNQDKILVPMVETFTESNANGLEGQLAALDSSDDSSLFVESKYITELSAIIDGKILKYIEETRRTEPTHSVEFQLEIIVKYIESNTRIAHTFYTPIPQDFLAQIKALPTSPFHPDETDISIVMSARRESFDTSRDDGWIISSNGSPIYLKTKIERIMCPHNIDVGQWLYSFLPKLGGGKQLLVEIKVDGVLFDKLASYIDSAEEAFRRWDSKSVFVNCREIGTYLNNQIGDLFESKSFIVRERWGRAYSNFERFASLDLHLEDLAKSNNYTRNEIIIQKSDSEYLLTQTKILINYA